MLFGKIHEDPDDSTGHPDPPARSSACTRGYTGSHEPPPSKALGHQLPLQGQGQGQGFSSPRALVTLGFQWTQARHLLDDVPVLCVHLGDGPQVPKDAEDLVHLPRHSGSPASAPPPPTLRVRLRLPLHAGVLPGHQCTAACPCKP